MSIINITMEDIQRGKPWEPGWHKVVVNSVSDSPSKDQGSINYRFTFALVSDPEKKTNENACLFNSKAIGRIIPFVTAVTGNPVNEAIKFDPSSFVGKELWIEVSNEPWNGNLVNKITGFAHKDTAPAF